ncbi:MAG: 50S ribosomal protein L30 [Candidatus Woesearchaeota archaeon]
MENRRIAIIRIHGKKGLRKDIKDTFNILRLYKKHNCVVVSNAKNFVGMLRKIDNYASWGEINASTLKLLLEKRGKLARKERLSEDYLKAKLKTSFDAFSKDVIDFKKELKDVPGLKLFFKLSPPKGGFERGGIKKQFAMGGASGYRKDKINDLIVKMV